MRIDLSVLIGRRRATVVLLCLLASGFGLLGLARPAGAAARRSHPRSRIHHAGRNHRRRPRPGRARPVRRRPSPRPVGVLPPAAVPSAPVARPLVTTTSAGAVTDDGATLTGTIVTTDATTQVTVEWGTSPAYGSSLSAGGLNGDGTAQSVAVALTGLTPGATYHARLVATDCGGCQAGTSDGADVTFTTAGYENPVYGSDDAADPSVLDNANTHDDYWAFVTGDRFPILHSSDLVHWTPAGLALAQRPAWAAGSANWHPWAPHVVQSDQPCPGTTGGGCYVMYYVALSAATGANCVAVATSPTPAGPYTDRGPLTNGTLDAAHRPVGCGDDQGYGQIDPSAFVDPASGARYLYVSEDFACAPGDPPCTSANSTLQPTISVIPLAPDGLSASGPRTPLFSGSPGGWEAAGASVPTVEGPMAVEHAGTYYLLYSGGSYRSQYAMGYATATSPLGPFTKATATPILSSSTTVIGPGGGDTPVTGPAGGQWLVYHGRQGSDGAPRVLRIDPFGWIPAAGGGPAIPAIAGPTSGPQATAP